MSMMTAVETPVRCAGVPSESNTAHITIDDSYTVVKEYSCVKGHNFAVVFDSPMNLPVFWECEDHEVISYEA